MKKIKDFENYLIDTNGDVFNASGNKLSVHINNGGYKMIWLSSKDKRKGFLLHRILAITFIPNPENKRTVNHINGIKTDNRLENLEWNTDLENTRHAIRIGLFNNTGINNGQSKLNILQVKEIRELIKNGEPTTKISKMFNVGITAIFNIKHNLRWK